MILTEVILKNYGVFRDENKFDFTCLKEKPIILIGGTNGAGKTTLFEAIMLCLYGKSIMDSRMSQKAYEKYLTDKIHKYLGTSISADHASIIVDFKFFHNCKIENYSVDRSWRNEEGKVVEKLTVTKNNKILDFVDESQWQLFIEELVPHGIAKLFFFDGEKIVRIAEEGNEEIEIKSSFDSLLGLDIVEQLHSDLRVHILRNTKANTSNILEEHQKLLDERGEYLEKIGRFENKLAEKNEEIVILQKEIEQIENKISKIGGGFASKREELKAKKDLIEQKLSFIKNNLRSLLMGSLPFALIPDLIKHVQNQLDEDYEIMKKRIGRESIEEKIQELALNKNKVFEQFNLTDNEKEKIISTILEILLSKNLNEKKPELFNFSLVERTNLVNLINSVDTQLENVKFQSTEYDKLIEELQKIEVALVNAPKDDEIGPLISKLNSLNINLGTLETEIKHLEEQISTDKSYVKLLNSKLRNIINEKYKNQNIEKQIELAQKIQKVLDEYGDKLKTKKLKLLEKYLLDSIHSLMHKENFIDKVSIDKETFEISLFRKDGIPIQKNLLSKGEQQMFATAILWALAKTSGKPLPFMIDTPLARLDVEHRDNLVNKFFPEASHQIIIFSTDSEINYEYYHKLLPFVSKSYSMFYNDEKGKSEQHNDYFWNEKGEKIIAF